MNWCEACEKMLEGHRVRLPHWNHWVSIGFHLPFLDIRTLTDGYRKFAPEKEQMMSDKWEIADHDKPSSELSVMGVKVDEDIPSDAAYLVSGSQSVKIAGLAEPADQEGSELRFRVDIVRLLQQSREVLDDLRERVHGVDDFNNIASVTAGSLTVLTKDIVAVRQGRKALAEFTQLYCIQEPADPGECEGDSAPDLPWETFTDEEREGDNS